MKNQLNGLLTKQMDRKDFLKHLAAGAMVVSGGAMIARAVNGDRPQMNRSSAGYGASAYGGVRKPGL